MEAKLAEYRAKKQREAKISEVKSSLQSLFRSFVKRKKEDSEPDGSSASLQEPLIDHHDVDVDCSSTVSEDDVLSFSYSDLFYYFLWFVLWVILFVVFIKLQFGTVYLIVSALILMYVNTRTGPKKSNEISAYSVFNKNCESIDGTLKAEQFEKEIRYGHGAVR